MKKKPLIEKSERSRQRKAMALRTGIVGLLIIAGIASTAIFNPKPLTPDAISVAKNLAEVPPPANTAADIAFLEAIRARLTPPNKVAQNTPSLGSLFSKTSFPQRFSGLALVLYQPGQKRILISRTNGTAQDLVQKAFEGLAGHPRLREFDIRSTEQCRIQMDFIVQKPIPCQFAKLSDTTLNINRFETGVDGLIAIGEEKRQQIFLPGDGFVKSLLGTNSIKKYIQKLVPKTSFKKLLFKRFRTQSYISYQDSWLPLYRGYPVVPELSPKDLETAVTAAIRWVVKNQKADGKFLYYYDPAKNNFVDHEHPKRDPNTNPYYNELRHTGVSLFLLTYYGQHKNDELLPHIRSALEFLMTLLVEYKLPDGTPAAHIFYNTKSKLGGSGLALYLLTEYQRITGDPTYREKARLLNNHLLNEIRDSGEFYYYHIYPGRAKDDPKSFSFYYPGEALIGLAGYYRDVATKEEKLAAKEKILKALDFLVYDRPKIYKQHFTSLPADSWLMMAINELWDIPELRDESYKKFVFDDADTMARLMYTEKDALYPDYVGSFYYKYGDHSFPDGARCEGLLGAYELAVKTHDKSKIDLYETALKRAAWATMHLVNTSGSAYSVENPELTIGGIRFKMTRQWFRIDTIQHVAAFYLKYLPYLIKAPETTPNTTTSIEVAPNATSPIAKADEEV